ncbi:MAG TPA: hypothetical protein VG713_15525 [Pirellulales bacterium]|jgi:hypothetical protein|nr:hypothetical protein [Pirellulales bacterium]
MIRSYLGTLVDRFGRGWNQFWFSPSDPLTVSLLRLLTGLLATWTLVTYTWDLDRLLGAQGFIPLADLKTLVDQRDLQSGLSGAYRFSYFDYLTTPGQLRAAHAVSIAVVAAYTLGLFSRVTSVAAWFIMLSYFHRTAIVTSQFEAVLVFLMLYLCLGPSGAYLSIDRWLKRRRSPAAATLAPLSSAATISLRLIQVHTCAMIVMMVLAKMYGDVWWNGTAMWWMMLNSPERIVDLRSWGSHFLGKYVLNAWTHAQVLLELLFPVLVWQRWARPLMIVWAQTMWSLLPLVSGLVSFSLAMQIAMIAFVRPDELRMLWAGFTARHPDAEPAAS